MSQDSAGGIPASLTPPEALAKIQGRERGKSFASIAQKEKMGEPCARAFPALRTFMLYEHLSELNAQFARSVARSTKCFPELVLGRSKSDLDKRQHFGRLGVCGSSSGVLHARKESRFPLRVISMGCSRSTPQFSQVVVPRSRGTDMTRIKVIRSNSWTALQERYVSVWQVLSRSKPRWSGAFHFPLGTPLNTEHDHRGLCS